MHHLLVEDEREYSIDNETNKAIVRRYNNALPPKGAIELIASFGTMKAFIEKIEFEARKLCEHCIDGHWKCSFVVASRVACIVAYLAVKRAIWLLPAALREAVVQMFARRVSCSAIPPT